MTEGAGTTRSPPSDTPRAARVRFATAWPCAPRGDTDRILVSRSPPRWRCSGKLPSAPCTPVPVMGVRVPVGGLSSSVSSSAARRRRGARSLRVALLGTAVAGSLSSSNNVSTEWRSSARSASGHRRRVARDARLTRRPQHRWRSPPLSTAGTASAASPVWGPTGLTIRSSIRAVMPGRGRLARAGLSISISGGSSALPVVAPARRPGAAAPARARSPLARGRNCLTQLYLNRAVREAQAASLSATELAHNLLA